MHKTDVIKEIRKQANQAIRMINDLCSKDDILIRESRIFSEQGREYRSDIEQHIDLQIKIIAPMKKDFIPEPGAPQQQAPAVTIYGQKQAAGREGIANAEP